MSLRKIDTSGLFIEELHCNATKKMCNIRINNGVYDYRQRINFRQNFNKNQYIFYSVYAFNN